MKHCPDLAQWEGCMSAGCENAHQYTSTSYFLPSFLKIYFIFWLCIGSGWPMCRWVQVPRGPGALVLCKSRTGSYLLLPPQDSSFICLRSFLISSQVCPPLCFLLIFMRIWGGVKLPTHWSGHAAGSDLWQLIANVYTKLLIVQRNGNP